MIVANKCMTTTRMMEMDEERGLEGGCYLMARQC